MAMNAVRIAHFTTVQVPPAVDGDGENAVNYLLSICRFSPIARTTLIDGEALQDIATLATLRAEDVKTMLKRRSTLAVPNGGFMYSIVSERRFHALVWWVKDTRAQGDVVDPNEWIDNRCNTALQSLDAKEAASTKDSDVKAPTAFNPKDWWNEEERFENYLGAKNSCDGMTPLVYVIREVMPAGWVPTTRREKLVYNAALAGPAYNVDNTEVCSALKQWTISTDGYDWIKSFDAAKDGRNAMNALRNHYSGPGE
eukprot:15343944-Ditylum_brightwellii.AAC.1